MKNNKIIHAGRRIAQSLTVHSTEVSLRWGSHRSEYHLGSHVIHEVQVDDVVQTVNVQDPILSGVTHRHIFQSRYMYWLKNVVFDSVTGDVLINGRIVTESLPDPAYRRRFAWPQPWRFSDTKSIVWGIRPTTYYHWLLEELPALLKAIRFEPSLEIWHNSLVPPYVPESIQSLDLAVRTTKGEIAVNQLLLLDRGKDSGWPHPNNVKELQNYINSLIAPNEPYSRVFISRLGSNRQSHIEERLEKLANSLGFDVLRLHEMSWIEQLRRIRGAKYIVAGHGAGLANIVAMNPGTTIHECMSTKYANPVYQILASQLGVHYRSTVGDIDEVSTWMHALHS